MTIDREELKRLCELAATRHGLPFDGNDGWMATMRLLANAFDRSIPSLLSALDAADREIERQRCVMQRNDDDWLLLREKHADLTLRLQIATDANVADRMRIDALEAGLREALHLMSTGRFPVEAKERLSTLLSPINPDPSGHHDA